MKSSVTLLSTALLLIGTAFAADTTVAPPVDQIQMKEHKGRSTANAPGSNARTLGSAIAMPVCTMSAKVPPSGTSGFVANVCVTLSGKASAIRVTGAQPNHIVYFDNLAAGTYHITGSAVGSTSLKTTFVIPAGKIGSACTIATYNSTGGVNYSSIYDSGASHIPAAFCV